MTAYSKEGQSKSEIIVVDFDWPSALLNMDHRFGMSLAEDKRGVLQDIQPPPRNSSPQRIGTPTIAVQPS
jgi:hypothetical protein